MRFTFTAWAPREYGDDSLNWPKSDAFKKVAEQLKSSGKVKMVGFSCHDGRLPDYLNAAAEGGFLDIIMLAFNPFYPKGGPVDKALDAAHKAGIGLVAMKTMRGTQDVPKRLPELDKLGLTTHQAVLHAAWSDPRISVVCNMIDNVDQMQSSSAAARSYKEPLKFAHLELLRDTILAGRRTMCTGCPGCEEEARKTNFAFHDIARFVTYYEQDGNQDARGYYQALGAGAPGCLQGGLGRPAGGLPFQDRLSGNHPPRRTVFRLNMKAHPSTLTRRGFLRSALLAPAGVALTSTLGGAAPVVAAEGAVDSTPVPTRKLGRSGPAVSMLILGGDVPAYSPEHLDIGWSLGIRYFDTASTYGNGNDELKVAAWLEKYPERRKELFLVSKDHPRQGPESRLPLDSVTQSIWQTATYPTSGVSRAVIFSTKWGSMRSSAS